jgi:ribosomal protein S27AE
MSEYIMKRTEVLCPNCMKKNVLQETKIRAYCDECGQGYEKDVDSNVLTFE